MQTPAGGEPPRPAFRDGRKAAPPNEGTPLLLDAHGALLRSDHLTDPVDRMLVATARIEQAWLVTTNRQILACAKGGRARVLATG